MNLEIKILFQTQYTPKNWIELKKKNLPVVEFFAQIPWSATTAKTCEPQIARKLYLRIKSMAHWVKKSIFQRTSALSIYPCRTYWIRHYESFWKEVNKSEWIINPIRITDKPHWSFFPRRAAFLQILFSRYWNGGIRSDEMNMRFHPPRFITLAFTRNGFH